MGTGTFGIEFGDWCIGCTPSGVRALVADKNGKVKDDIDFNAVYKEMGYEKHMEKWVKTLEKDHKKETGRSFTKEEFEEMLKRCYETLPRDLGSLVGLRGRYGNISSRCFKCLDSSLRY